MMVEKLTAKKTQSADPKKRVILIVIASVVVITVVVFLFKAWKENSRTQAGSSISGTPLVESVQGGDISPEYMRALQKNNNYTAQRAQDTGLSAIGTIINTGVEPTGCVVCNGGEESLVQALSRLVNDGKISPAVEKLLSNLADQNVSVAEFAAKLQDLVKEGTLTPEDARALLEAYKALYKLMAEQAGAEQMNPMIQQGSLPLDAADILLQMQAEQVPVAEYSAQLQKLVRARRISSHVANALLSQYKKITQERLDREALGQLNALVTRGEVSQDVASTLSALQGTSVPVGTYAEALDRLVNDQQLMDMVAGKLLAQYKTRMGVSTDDAGISDGQTELATEDMATLKQLQANNAPIELFANNLQTMVAEDRLSSSVAERILKDYEKEVSAKAAALKTLQELESEGKVSRAIVHHLTQLQNKRVPMAEYRQVVGDYVSSNTIPLADQSTLLVAYQMVLKAANEKDQLLEEMARKSRVPPGAAKQLEKLQEQGASLSNYADHLRRLVESGEISPQTAAALLAAYQNKLGQSGSAAASFTGGVASVGASNAFSDTGNSSLNAIQQRAAAQQNAAQQQRVAAQQAKLNQQEQARVAQEQQAYETQVSALSQRMMAQAQQLLTNNWTPTPQTLVIGDLAEQGGGKASGGGVGGKDGQAAPGHMLIKAGEIMYAVLDTAVNSDYESSPVMATLVAGPFKGGKLLGTITTSDGPGGDRVILEFSTLTMKSWSAGVQVDAFAIDPETARTAIATSVDHHYMMRFGATFAAAFMEGLGQAVADSGATTTTNEGVTTDTTDEYSTSDEVLIALGEVGAAMSDNLSEFQDRPPTVRVKAGVGLGILFMNDVVSSETSAWEGNSAQGGGASDQPPGA